MEMVNIWGYVKMYIIDDIEGLLFIKIGRINILNKKLM